MKKECGRQAAFLGHVRQGYRICRSDTLISFASACELSLAPSQGIDIAELLRMKASLQVGLLDLAPL